MSKTKQQKQETVKQYSELLKDNNSIIVFRPNGITANEASSLKKELHNLKANFNVVKNTLFKISLKDSNLPEIESFAGGENAVIFCSESNITDSAKLISEFIKKSEKGEITAGILSGKKLEKTQVVELASLPPKDQLLGQLLSVFNGPMRGLVTVLNGNMRELVYALNAIKETKPS
jgi:large subunit ribosomal protein L10